LSQYAHSLIFRFLLPYLEQLAQLQINTFNPVGPVYFYHPLTPLDMSVFDEFILEEGAYEFIEGAINILGHEGLLPILEDIKKKKKP
jgi:hypothetical protein